MGKAIIGAVEIAAVVGLFAVAPYAGTAVLTFVTSTAGSTLLVGIGLMGVGMEVGALADLFKAGPQVGVVTRQAAQPRRIIYGCTRVAPTIVFESTTGSKNRLNHIQVWCAHQIDNLVSIYLDGKQVHFANNGYNGTDGTWGQGDGNDYISQAGNHYNFGSGIYAEHRFGYAQQTVRDKSGNPAPLYMTSLQGNDSSWTSTCTLNGLAYTYLKIDYDPSQFPNGQPNVRATITGKNDILDPRTNKRGYTNNAALVIADFLCNQDWGMRLSWADLDLDELIASANVCDELVSLANGSSEPRYTINGTFTADTAPADVLESLLMACAGRISYSGGKFGIIVGYDRGVTVAYDDNDLTGPVHWSSKRSARELFNSVSGTFICPVYPYVAAGNYYRQDGPYEQGTFDGAYQPTTYPPYDLSSARGYTQYALTDGDGNPILDSNGNPENGDVYLAEDNGIRMYTDSKLQFVTSIAQAQRLGRIKLMRHRNQGTGSLPMKVTGLQVTAGDNIQFSFPTYGWVNKEFEVTQFRFVPKVEDGQPPVLETELTIQEMDPTAVYAWSTSDELPMNAPDYITNYDPAQITQPTNLIISSGASTQVTTSDGIVHPRILATWTAPADGMVIGYQIQYQVNGAGWWLNGPSLTAADTQAYLAGFAQGDSVTVRIRSLRQNGAASPWITDGPQVVSTSNTVITTAALNPNSPANTWNNATVDSIVENGAATIRIYGPGGDGSAWMNYAGAVTITVPSAHITGLTENAMYYVVWNTSTSTYAATQTYTATLADNLLFLGRITTASSTTSGGTTTTTPGTSGGGGRLYQSAT